MYPRLTIKSVKGFNGKNCDLPFKNVYGTFYGCWGKNSIKGATYCHIDGKEHMCHDSSNKNL